MESTARKFGHLVERVYEATRAQILDGTYPPGAPLRLGKLAKDNQVSLIPVREALRLLESERFVVSEVNKGARVAPLSMQSLEDLYRVRVLLETEALKLASRKMDESFIESLESTISEAIGSLQTGETEKGLALHQDFHHRIYALSGSDWLCHMIDNLWAHSERYIQLASGQSRFVCTVDDNHHAIIDRLMAGDAEGAAQSPSADLLDTVEMLRGELDEVAVPVTNN